MEIKYFVLANKVSEGKWKDGNAYRLQTLTIGTQEGDTVKYKYYGKHVFKQGEQVPLSVGLRYSTELKDNILCVVLVMQEDK